LLSVFGGSLFQPIVSSCWGSRVKHSVVGWAMKSLICTLLVCLICLVNLPARAAPQIDLKTVHYEVKAETTEELRRELDAKAPIRIGSEPFHGKTTWRVQWSVRWILKNASCRVRNAETSVNITITLPKWLGYESAEAKVKVQWDQYYEYLVNHHNWIKNQAIKAGEELEREILDMEPRPNCTMLVRDGDDFGHEIVEQLGARIEQYATEKEHRRKTREALRVIPPTEAKQKKESFGTGFFIAESGYLLTNHHVAANCSDIAVQNKGYKSEARLFGSDAKNDLAVLVVEDKNVPGVAKFRSGKSIRVGEDITVVGYPFGFMLGTGIKATTGNVSASTGLLDDVGQMQISAPVQPGNSGGPVLDRSGNVVGIVSSKLSEIAVAQLTGSMPQNVNFAIKSSFAQIFLDANRVKFESSSSRNTLEVADVVDQAIKYTVKVRCRAGNQ